MSPPRIKAVLRPVNLPSCGGRETEGSKAGEGQPPQPPHGSPPGPARHTSFVNFMVCRASSRVGERMRARAPVCALRAFSRSNIGRRKQAVLPLPVRAMATTSLPSKITGMVCQTYIEEALSARWARAGHRPISTPPRISIPNSCARRLCLPKLGLHLVSHAASGKCWVIMGCLCTA